MNNKKILIIEDEEDSIIFIERILKNLGLINNILAKDGAEGFAKAKNEIPDLIILDIQLPEMNGFEVFNKLRMDQVLKNIPVIILTALSERIGTKVDKNGIKDYFGKEPAAFLDKPINPEEFAGIVKKILNI